MEHAIKILMSVLLLLSAFFLPQKGRSWKEEQSLMTMQEKVVKTEDLAEKTVVLDPGHGGEDPGMVGIDGILEKEINLQIARKVKERLEQSNVQVLMTRDSDTGLYEETDTQKKARDMQKRCQIIEEMKPDCTVSIHQNSYTDSSVCGPQVFYYKHSADGKKLAEILQNQMNAIPKVSRTRVQKENDTYYILKRSQGVAVIAECCFLSNPKEAQKIQTEEYQNQIADAIAAGIKEYLTDEA